MPTDHDALWLQRRAALLSFMDTHKLKPYPWTLASGRSESLLRGFLRGPGPKSMTDEAYEDLAQGASALIKRPVTGAELRGETAGLPIAINSYVGPGAEIVAFNGPAQTLSQTGPGAEVIAFHGAARAPTYVESPAGSTTWEAVVVQGDSAVPLFEDGDVLFHPPMDTDAAQYLGRVMIVEVKDGPRLLRRLLRGSTRHRFHLVGISPATAALDDRIVAAVAPIAWIKRRVA